MNSVSDSHFQQTLATSLHATQVVRQSHGFKTKPFEWLYEGLQPLLLPDVLARKWGIPLSLAVLYTCIGLRLGVSLMPQKIRHTPAGRSFTTANLHMPQAGLRSCKC